MSQSMFEFHRIVKFWICFNGIFEFSFITVSLLNSEYNNNISLYIIFAVLLTHAYFRVVAKYNFFKGVIICLIAVA